MAPKIRPSGSIRSTPSFDLSVPPLLRARKGAAPTPARSTPAQNTPVQRKPARPTPVQLRPARRRLRTAAGILVPVWRGLVSLLLLGSVTGWTGQHEASARQLPTAEFEKEIHEAEQLEVRAILEGDAELQERIWGDDFVVTNARGEVLTKLDVMSVFARGMTPYRRFERETQSVRVYGADKVAVAIGEEWTVATGAETDEPVPRRYTHVWVQRDVGWQLVARQSVVVREP